MTRAVKLVSYGFRAKKIAAELETAYEAYKAYQRIKKRHPGLFKTRPKGYKPYPNFTKYRVRKYRRKRQFY